MQPSIMARAGGYILITFDVDGTLLHSPEKHQTTNYCDDPIRPSAHSRAFSHAVGQILQVGEDIDRYDTRAQQPLIIPPVHTLLPREHVAGSTDGLILLRLARAALHKESAVVFPQLDALMHSMDEYFATLDDDEIARDIEPLPGVLETLQLLATMRFDNNTSNDSNNNQPNVMCGLVTGNVEGLARRKMRATGIAATGALAPPAPDQLQRSWSLGDDAAFLGGFGSDYCSGDIDDMERNHLDRGEQISICADRCRALVRSQQSTTAPNVDERASHHSCCLRVVHVGDAPADVLAAKAYARRQQEKSPTGVCVGMVAVATGKYSVQELKDAAGENVRGQWECVILENGMADPRAFLRACGILVVEH